MATTLLSAPLTDDEKTQALRYALTFKLFAKAAWPVIEPGTPLSWNWHLDVICDHLQAVFERRIKRLAITLAPGHAKSSLSLCSFRCGAGSTTPIADGCVPRTRSIS